MAGSKMGQEQWGEEGQMADKGRDGRIQEGHMAVSVGGGQEGRWQGAK